MTSDERLDALTQQVSLLTRAVQGLLVQSLWQNGRCTVCGYFERVASSKGERYRQHREGCPGVEMEKEFYA
jgi:hypothetical protein